MKPALFARISSVLLVVVAAWAADGQEFLVKKELVWSRPETEIASPQFSADGNFVVLVTRVHWPDGDEAEGLPESFFKQLQLRRSRDPRFADPVIRLIDLKGNSACEISYGSSPTVSPDNKTIVFSRQRNPITGMRALAETQSGNDIQVFDCEKRQARTLAQPGSGYFDSPVFLADGRLIAYTENEAVNGAMGGPVGIERVDLTGAQKDILLTKEATPAVPCPPEGSPKAGFEAFMCSQPTKLSSDFPDLLLDVASADGQLIVLQAKPVPSPGDMYLAKHYSLRLLSVFPERNEILSLGQADMGGLGKVSLQSASDRRVLIFSQHWKPFSLKTRDWLPEIGPRNTNRRSIYSPDLKYYLLAEPTEEPSHISLYQTENGQRLFTSAAVAGLYDMAWSRDSKRFAVVVVPKGAVGSAYREDLVVYSIP
ncbi:MAG TPA: hypothetical protein VK302_08255 [Terriglobales bacterium]|nr:hypothetical protein [Terriglobales bacterium]